MNVSGRILGRPFEIFAILSVISAVSQYAESLQSNKSGNPVICARNDSVAVSSEVFCPHR